MVGAICSRVEPVEDSTSSFKIYIMTIGVLAPYRRIGIGAWHLLFIMWRVGTE